MLDEVGAVLECVQIQVSNPAQAQQLSNSTKLCLGKAVPWLSIWCSYHRAGSGVYTSGAWILHGSAACALVVQGISPCDQLFI